MDWQRIVLIMGMAIVGVMLLIQWNDFQEARQPILENNTTTSTVISPVQTDTPRIPDAVPANTTSAAVSDEIPTPTGTAPAVIAEPKKQGSRLISVKTDSLHVLIDTYGGDIVKASLPKYPVEIDRPDEPLVLLNRNDSTTYIAQSGLVGTNGTDLTNGERPTFSAAKTDYVLTDREDSLQVDLVLQKDNVTITKRFTFKHDDNLIGVEYLIDNNSSSTWNAHFYAQIKRDDHDPVKSTPGIGMSNFLGVASTTDEENYSKYKFKDLEEKKVEFRKTGGWVSFVQHYFISAWIPEAESEYSYSFRKLSNRNQYLFGLTGPATIVEPGQQGIIKSSFYAGPKDIHRLEEISPHLELTIDYGPLFFICKPLFYFLNWLHGFVGNWGVAIILLTICIKAAFFHLSAKSYRSMAKMRKFSPKLAELKERYGDNREQFQKEMMSLYKKEGVNPMGGCLPMLVQIPVFIALYWVLMESVELRHAPFFLWIEDLSVKDPLFILPLIYGASMFLQQKLQPAIGDPTQQKIMQMMPIVFTFLFLFFASGLVLYWIVNNSLGMLQQFFIYRQIEKADAKN
ncbi:MAG: membrane protein insertase YidC [Cellvibrionaceae bacterium]